jgi:hypothetical protein
MNDQGDNSDHKQNMNETARYMERRPRHDPNDKKKCGQNQKEEVSHFNCAQ